MNEREMLYWLQVFGMNLEPRDVIRHTGLPVEQAREVYFAIQKLMKLPK